ncbi:MAG: HYR domain-containing protein, partial [Phaeodactylibacter sp.]|nr:HYR domain-containing protein [Phaeodactylibacter sp.]
MANLPIGTHQVCLTIIDATGCSATVQQTVTVVGDNTPPVLNCPPDQTIPTDPGLCTAFYQPIVTATDDCTDTLILSCTLTGATSGTLPTTNIFNKGITTVTCVTEDEKGNIADCTFTVTVVDQELPTIVCPGPVTASTAACSGGTVVNFSSPVVADNCPMVTWACSHQSGDFFPCGTTMVTCTATDMAGNQATCSFPVTVDCACAEVGGETIFCTDFDDQFGFTITVIDLTGSGTNGCTMNVSSPQSGITISGVTISGSGPGYTISGLIDVAAPPLPTSIQVVVDVTCVCPGGDVHNCSFPINLTTPCCKEISIDPQEICADGPTVQIPLLGCNTLYDVQQVRWYVADAPCPPAAWGPPIQVTNGCAPLTLSPQYHNGDVCVYAEVDMGPGAGPCTMLTSNIETITLCNPISCSLPDQAYCWTGSPITPAPLTISLNPATLNCIFNIDWYDPNGNLIPGASGMTTYQPPALNFTGANTDCAQTYTYTAVVSNVCGQHSCTSTIRLDNDNAPEGTLVLLPPDVNPLCY